MTEQNTRTSTPRSVITTHTDVHPNDTCMRDLTENTSITTLDTGALSPQAVETVQPRIGIETIEDATNTPRNIRTEPVHLAAMGNPETNMPKPMGAKSAMTRTGVTDATENGTSTDIPTTTDTTSLTVLQYSLPPEITLGPTGISEQMDDYDLDNLPDLVLPQTQSGTTDPKPQQTVYSAQTPARMTSDNSSHPSVTPRSVLSDPDESEIETANTLLSLGSLENIDQAVDNETLLPVNKPRTEDFTKDLADQEQTHRDNTNEDTDSDKTVDYGVSEPVSPDKHVEEEEIPSPKGIMRYKHYGIRRHSPTTSKTRRMRCFTCNAICNSKRQLSKHHHIEHANVTCPDCGKVFLTPDALTRHRYSHKEDHQYSCDTCRKVCAFESDLM